MSRILFLLFTFHFLLSFEVKAQYPPQVGQSGSTAISASSPLLTGWAAHCTVQRGFLDIAQLSLGYATAGDSANAIGPADGSIVSLGDSGVAELSFNSPIYNGPGADFAVFENGFLDASDPNLAYLELGFVEVSSDGINYFRFPATSLTQDTSQIGNANYLDARNINNLAGKYIGGYGTPFDLQELSGISGLDINNITHVRIIDVIGSINGHASYDSAGRKINDPYPTPFPSCGFDLDAVGVIHQITTGLPSVINSADISIYPNPVTEKIMVSSRDEQNTTVVLTDIQGKKLLQQTLNEKINEIPVGNFPAGIYYLILKDSKGSKWVEKITKL